MLDITTCTRIIEQSFPGITSNNLQIYNSSWSFIVIIVNKDIVFRFPKNDESAAKIVKEVTFLSYFKDKTSLPVPDLSRHTYHNCIYETYKILPGVPLDNIIQLTPQLLDNIATELGIFLTKLHSIESTEIAKIGLKKFDVYKYWKTRSRLVATTVFPLITQMEKEWVIFLFTLLLKIIEESTIPFCINHSDLYPKHILTNSSHISGIIDFSEVTYGDPAWDFQFETYFGKKFVETIYKHYHSKKDDLFDTRRKLYEACLYLTHIEHALERNDVPSVKKHLQKLFSFISLHPSKTLLDS